MVMNEACRRENERPLNLHSSRVPRRLSISELHIIYDAAFRTGKAGSFGVSAGSAA